MKKILLSLTAIMMLAFNLNAQEQGDGSYLSFGSDTTLLIHPMLLGLSYRINVDAHFEHRYDSWTIDFEAPEGMRYSGYDRSSGMDVPYLRSDGSNDVYAAVLTNNTGGNVYSSTITEYGYWDSDSDGIYETYGIVKWEPGDYDSMLKLRFDIDDDFRQGHIVLSGEVLSTSDARGDTGFGQFEKTYFVKVGYRRGDLNGDGAVDINDVSVLNAYVLGASTLNEFQLDAAEVYEDGVIDVNDLTALIQMVLTGQG